MFINWEIGESILWGESLSPEWQAARAAYYVH
jgi:hypothetical protein